MKRLVIPAIALVASSFALSVPSMAAMERSTHETAGWSVLQGPDASSYVADCYASDRAPGPDERRLSGPYTTEAQANAAMGNIAACLPGIHN